MIDPEFTFDHLASRSRVAFYRGLSAFAMALVFLPPLLGEKCAIVTPFDHSWQIFIAMNATLQSKNVICDRLRSGVRHNSGGFSTFSPPESVGMPALMKSHARIGAIVDP